MAIRVSVVFSPAPREVREVVLQLEDGATVAVALQRGGLEARIPGAADDPGMVGVWGRKASMEQVLRNMDRVELYRALKVDPKVARRTRFVGQGVRSTGLFARRRPGGKAGY